MIVGTGFPSIDSYGISIRIEPIIKELIQTTYAKIRSSFSRILESFKEILQDLNSNFLSSIGAVTPQDSML
ncbi:hypothetical protein CICLE_v10023203mg [Citrus x clementina]|uniref:Uncharacterized protein n=2 Tax=Citrus TaxID=2706 RepID=A0A067FD04_CITSI|nr:hypothetical protein CICLE_v10023203mg [Citrus x clementina]KDO64040.1 hypothetical protein CISIN_1g035219mg [Citrus sinensis]